MGKKKNSDKKSKDKNDLPFVSICTPTFNRRPFIPFAIKCFMHQDYPKDKMEWIIIDDGTDKIEDLVCDISHVKYFKYDEKMSLGKKRNLMHEKSKGDIIVYMDDDDYYPQQRVSHAVNMLQTHPNALCAGSSEIYIWFKHINQMYQFGPYGPNHATAGTFAFKRELLKDHKYDDHAALAEEKAFLKNYTVPFVQLEPKKTILVFSHIQNTFDKKKLLANGENQFQKRSPRTVDEFIKEPEMKEFYMETIEKLLENYKPGDPSNKPDVLKQIKEIEEERGKMMAQQQANNGGNGGKIILNQNGQQVELNNQQIVQIMQKQQEQLQHFTKLLQEKDDVINKLQTDLDNYKNMNDKMNNIIQLLQIKSLNESEPPRNEILESMTNEILESPTNEILESPRNEILESLRNE
jgi:glycosyltransferase involved in cell wall biosynthesis